eukprot:2495744-Prorocentrum_lima.AAC.1
MRHEASIFDCEGRYASSTTTTPNLARTKPSAIQATVVQPTEIQTDREQMTREEIMHSLRNLAQKR